MPLAGNTTAWAEVTQELATGGADTIEVLCRYRQSAASKWVGESGAFADLQLVELGADPDAPPAATLPPDARSATEGSHTATVNPAAIAAGNDVYVTPTSAGSKDGSSWDNAAPGNGVGALQAAWNATGEAKTCHVGSGLYTQQSLQITAGGHDIHTPKRLLGEDTGGGLPVFRSTWTKDDPSHGASFVEAAAGASYWWLQDLKVEHYQLVVRLLGQNVGLHILNVDMTDTRIAMTLEGGATVNDLLGASHDILIKDCDVTGFTKNAIRIQGGVYQVRVVNCHADAGGKPYATEKFHMCFHASGGSGTICDHDIAYIGCSARNSYDDAGDKYWNGDGFAAERNVYNLSYVDCNAFDCTDGGWDDKSLNPTLVGCVSLRNKRNFRLWSQGGATLIRCLGAYGHLSGSGTSCGLYACRGALVKAIDCTFYNNPIQVDLSTEKTAEGRRTRIELDDCIVGSDTDPVGSLYRVEENGDLARNGVVEYLKGQAGADPKLSQVTRDWDGTGEAFVSQAFGPDKGFSR